MLEVGKRMMTRRNLIRGASVGAFGAAGAAVLAACGEAQVVEKIVTREVIKEVPVETIVTREVVKEVPVESVVTREIIKEVPVEKIVTQEVVQQVIKEVPVTTEKVVTVEKARPGREGRREGRHGSRRSSRRSSRFRSRRSSRSRRLFRFPTSVQAGQPVVGGDLRVSWGGGIAGAQLQQLHANLQRPGHSQRRGRHLPDPRRQLGRRQVRGP